METQNTVMKVQSPNVEIIPRKINVEGRELLVQLLRMGEQEGLLSSQVSSYLGVTKQNINYVIDRHNLISTTLSCQFPAEVKADLRTAGFIGRRGSLPSFLPKETIQGLVKIVNTPQAWAIYRQLWEMVENPRTYIAVSVLYT